MVASAFVIEGQLGAQVRAGRRESWGVSVHIREKERGHRVSRGA